MNSVDRVKIMCKERKIPISRIEKDLGFANGYIGQLKKGTFPNDRLIAIAEYLNVSAEYLTTGEEKGGGETYYLNDETTAIAQEIFERKELKMLFDAAKNSTPQRLKAYYDMIVAMEKAENHDED